MGRVGGGGRKRSSLPIEIFGIHARDYPFRYT